MNTSSVDRLGELCLRAVVVRLDKSIDALQLNIPAALIEELFMKYKYYKWDNFEKISYMFEHFAREEITLDVLYEVENRIFHPSHNLTEEIIMYIIRKRLKCFGLPDKFTVFEEFKIIHFDFNGFTFKYRVCQDCLKIFMSEAYKNLFINKLYLRSFKQLREMNNIDFRLEQQKVLNYCDCCVMHCFMSYVRKDILYGWVLQNDFFDGEDKDYSCVKVRYAFTIENGRKIYKRINNLFQI